jgi:hypothetical protein
MAASPFRVGVQPGDGLVARYGDVAVVVARGADAFTDALLRRVSVAYDDPRALVWQVVGLMAAHRPEVPPFALAVGAAESRRVLVHGSARVVVDGDELRGDGLWTWREQEVAPHASLALTVGPVPVVAAPGTDLRDAVLNGAGLVFETAAKASAPRPPSEEEVGTAIRRLAHETVRLADRIAVLQADDGSRVALDRNYVFGRDPRRDPDVVRGAASPIRIDDGEQLISRVHAYLVVTGDGVAVRDAGSANGSYIAAPGDDTWTRIGHDPVPVPVGHSVRFGLRVYTHVSADDNR